MAHATDVVAASSQQSSTAESSSVEKPARNGKRSFEAEADTLQRTSRRLQEKVLKQIQHKNDDDKENEPTKERSPSPPPKSPKRKKSREKLEQAENTAKREAPARKANGGLTNLGNTCFMNATLQALFGMPIFVSALRSFLSKVQAHPGSLLNAVATLIGATAAEEREKALEALRGIIVAQHADFDNNDMHDAQEFLTVLLQNLAKESAELINEQPGLECPIAQTFQFSWVPLRGCTNGQCGGKIVEGKEEDSYHLSLNVPDTASSIQSCISTCFNSSTIQKKCDKCGENIEHSQKTRLNRLPRVLIVHLQRLTPKFDEKTKQYQLDKKSTPIELSSSVSVKFVMTKGVDDKQAVFEPLAENELKHAIESIEQMKKWEGAKSTNTSTIVVEDNKKMMTLGPRAIKQLTEDQQLKLAMARSMQSEDDVDEEYDENEIVELDSQTDYMSKTDKELLNTNAALDISREPLLSESYALLATINHHGSQADSGHYTADVLNPMSEKWLAFNDQRVRTILEKTVKSRKKLCYLLFYMRKEYGLQIRDNYDKFNTS